MPASQKARLTEAQGVALLVIDVQRGLFGKAEPVYQAEALVANICLLIERAHLAGITVFYIQHTNDGMLAEGTEAWQLHPQLLPAAGDVCLQKRHSSVFKERTLTDALSKREVGTVIVTGLVTHGCVKAACLDAESLGYRTILVSDGHSNFNKDAQTIIELWNRELNRGAITVLPAEEVARHMPSQEFAGP